MSHFIFHMHKFENYPLDNFFQPRVAVPIAFHPPPFNAHLGNIITNPISVSNLQTRPVFSEGSVGSSQSSLLLLQKSSVTEAHG